MTSQEELIARCCALRLKAAFEEAALAMLKISPRKITSCADCPCYHKTSARDYPSCLLQRSQSCPLGANHWLDKSVVHLELDIEKAAEHYKKSRRLG